MIDGAEKGYVVWGRDEAGAATGFQIVHMSKCDDKSKHKSNALRDFLGANGLAKLTAMMSYGSLANTHRGEGPKLADLDEFTDFLRRVQIPFYEEARPYFSTDAVMEHFHGSSQTRPYMQDALQTILQISDSA